MYYLNEDPLYVLLALGLGAAVCLIALRVTQQGKFLVWAGALSGLAALLFLGERLWVTDAERVEAVVYDLAEAVEASDISRIESHLDGNPTLGRQGQAGGVVPAKLFLSQIRQVRFDFVRVGRLHAAVGDQSRRGSAEFKVTTSGTLDEGGHGDLNFAATASEWSLGFRETAPGVWKINRITAINLPRYAMPILMR